MKIVVLGSNGQLGREFVNYLQTTENKIFAFSHSMLDIEDFGEVFKTFRSINPDVVINCAAYTKVDKAEEEKDLAYGVNAIGAKNVSFASFEVNAKVVYFSTDYVFNGEKDSPYIEIDTPEPISTYGKSKFWGEQYTKEFNPNHLILRVSWLYGVNGNNFVKTVIRLTKHNKYLRIVNDQYGTPTYTLDVVKQTIKLLENDRIGIYHLSNIGGTTWFEFAHEILRDLGLQSEVIPISSEEYPTLAKRPKHSVLKNYFLELEKLNIMRQWKVALEDFINNYKERLLNE